MKMFVYAIRGYDELTYLKQIQEEEGLDIGYTTDYPTLENAELARGCEGIIIITNKMYPELLDKFYEVGVRFIATRTIGYDHIDLEHCRKLGIRVCNITYSANSVANYTIMMMLMACRQMPYIMQKAALQDFSLQGKLGRELSLETVGVIGTGKIGETLIRHLSGFGCRILAYDPYQKDSLRDLCTYVDLDTLYASSDIITLHVPGLPENYHMIDAPEFEKMKDGVILVNAARGTLINNDALLDALESGKIGFAALDTFDTEQGLYYHSFEHQVMTNRYRALLSTYPNVLLSPHMAFYTAQAVYDMIINAVKGLLQFERGEKNPFEL